MEYAKITSRLFMANDQKVFEMTGCLSKCDKYVYNAEAEGSFLALEADSPEQNDTLTIQLMLVTGEYEERKQVNSTKSKVINLPWDNYLWFQYFVYDFDAFIADVGGFLGLLLGQSVFGIYEWITQNLPKNKAAKCYICHS